MKIGQSTNEYGTPVSVHICDACATRFTVCPPAGEDWGGCQAVTCETYDRARDADRLFDEKPWLIQSEEL